MGNPNVGKSAVFSRLTGVNVIISNYPGTTVEYKKGYMRYKDKEVELIDVPGTYTLEPITKAEKVAVEMFNEGDIIINVIDATNLERNLYLTTQLLEKGKPIIIALNMWDEAEHTGIKIDVKKLESLLGVPVIPTVAITGYGIKELVSRLKEAKKLELPAISEDKRWQKIGKIVRECQTITHRHPTLIEKIGDASVKPISGTIIALIVLLLAFMLIRFIGENLIRYVLDPIFELYRPLAMKISTLIGKGFLHDIIIGALIDGQIDYTQSMGLLTTGLYVPLAMVLPYVLAFYIVLSFLEDFGYLPRLAVVVDNIMHRIGVHGAAIIPMLLGLGCNVPGALSTRILESKRERFITATLMAIAVPCMAQIAMVIGLVGRYGIPGLGVVFLTLFLVWIVIGLILNKILKGETPEIFIEIPPYRLPYFKSLFKKIWARFKAFLTSAVPYVLIGVLIINILYSLGFISFISKITSPIMLIVFGLPSKAIVALIIGFLRKDVAVGMLMPLNLTLKQLIITSVVLTMYFPCIATFIVLLKELGIKGMLKSTLIMILSTFIVGFLLNIILP